MADWLDELLQPAEIVPADGDEVVAAPDDPPGGEALVETVTDQLFQETTTILQSALAFADIEPGATEPPQEWIDRFGEDGALKRFRIAQYAQLTHKDAPIGLEIATKVAVGITKAKLDRSPGNRPLNVQFVRYEQTTNNFPEVILEEKRAKRRR